MMHPKQALQVHRNYEQFKKAFEIVQVNHSDQQINKDELLNLEKLLFNRTTKN